MKIATIITRSLLGLIFVVFGSNIFVHFIPMPPPPEGPARDFTTALFVSHFLYVVGALQVVGGLLLFTGRWTPLGLTLVGPVRRHDPDAIYLKASGGPLQIKRKPSSRSRDCCREVANSCC